MRVKWMFEDFSESQAAEIEPHAFSFDSVKAPLKCG
jgi:hypothetical protein